MDLERFYALIHAPMGYRALLSGGNWIPKWASSTKELLHRYGHLLLTKDLYHTCHTYESPTNRTKTNATWFKCAHVDIDIREAKGEANEDIVLEKLIAVEAYYGQRLTIIRSGGGGFHVYISFKEAVERPIWDNVSNKLVSLVRGIQGVDTACTMDAARILRVPGSIHSKSGNIVSVEQWGEEHYKPIYVNGHKFEPKKTQEIDSRYASITLIDLINTCGHIKKLSEGWEGQPYESWLGCATVLKRVQGGSEAFHIWSSQASNYDEEAAIRVLETTSGIDAQHCAVFKSCSEKENPCDACPYYSEDANPLKATNQSLVKSNGIMEPAQTPLPYGYEIDKSGAIILAVSNGKDKGKDISISNRAIYVDAVYQDLATENEVVSFRYRYSDNRGWGNVSVPKGKALTNEGAKIIGDKVTLNMNKWPMYAYDAICRYETEEGKSVMPLANFFGWRTHKGEDVFVLGHDVIGKDGIIGHAYTDTQDQDMKKTASYLSAIWPDKEREEVYFREAYSLMNKFMADPTVHFASKLQVAASLMAPLFYYAVKYVPEAGLGGIMLNVYGETGKGKSLGVKVGASIWGKPGGEGIPGLMHSNISMAAVWIALEKARHLPFCLDEVLSNPIGAEPKLLDDFIKCISNGKGPDRATPDGKPRPSSTFNCPVLSSSQGSLIDFSATGVSAAVTMATRMRLIEYEIPGSGQVFKNSPYDRFFSLYGVIGRRWLIHFLKPDVRADFEEHLRKMQFGEFKSEGRFIARFLHMLKWVIKEAAHDRAGVLNLPVNLASVFEATQKEALEEAEHRRALTPAQATVLAYLSRYRDRSLTYGVMPNGRIPLQQRTPTNKESNAYQYGTVMYLEVLEPDSVVIPVDNLTAFYKDTVKDRNYISEMQQLKKDKMFKIAQHVNILGYKDVKKTPDCYVFPRAVIQAWQSLQSGIIEGTMK